MPKAPRCWLALMLLCLIATSYAADTQRRVALTFDDLPAVGLGDTPKDPSLDAKAVTGMNRAILSALRQRKAPAVGFVVESHVEALGLDTGREVLREWIRGGFTLANHTRNHRDSNALSLAQIDAEIAGGSASAGALMQDAGKKLQYLRFPFNHTGDTAQKQAGILKLAAKHDLVMAASTIDTSDYLFDQAYRRAVAANDRGTAVKIRMAYLDYSITQIDYYAALGAQVLGYEPPQVMLLHVNRLNADTLPQLLAIFENKGYRFVTLDEAQADAAYQAPSTFVSKFGPMWGYRWARERGVKVDGSREQEPPSWIAGYAETGVLPKQ